VLCDPHPSHLPLSISSSFPLPLLYSPPLPPFHPISSLSYFFLFPSFPHLFHPFTPLSLPSSISYTFAPFLPSPYPSLFHSCPTSYPSRCSIERNVSTRRWRSARMHDAEAFFHRITWGHRRADRRRTDCLTSMVMDTRLEAARQVVEPEPGCPSARL